MHLALDNPQWLICLKIQPINQLTEYSMNLLSPSFLEINSKVFLKYTLQFNCLKRIKRSEIRVANINIYNMEKTIFKSLEGFFLNIYIYIYIYICVCVCVCVCLLKCP